MAALLACLGAAGDAWGDPVPARKQVVDEAYPQKLRERVLAAIERGVLALRKEQAPDGSWGGVGTALRHGVRAAVPAAGHGTDPPSGDHAVGPRAGNRAVGALRSSEAHR